MEQAFIKPTGISLFKPKAQHNSSKWTIVAAMALLSSIGFFIAAVLPTWRVMPPIVYNYIQSSKLRSDNIPYSNYGLYIVDFSGGKVSMPWFRLTDILCSATDTFAPITALLDVGFKADCPRNCVDHFRTRCATYRKLTTSGYWVFGTLLICGVLGILGAGWTLIFGINVTIVQLLWMGSGFAVLFICSYWCFVSGQAFGAWQQQAYIPFPTLSYALWIAVASGILMSLMGVLVTIGTFSKDSKQWKQQKASIDDKILTTSPNKFDLLAFDTQDKKSPFSRSQIPPYIPGVSVFDNIHTLSNQKNPPNHINFKLPDTTPRRPPVVKPPCGPLPIVGSPPKI